MAGLHFAVPKVPVTATSTRRLFVPGTPTYDSVELDFGPANATYFQTWTSTVPLASRQMDVTLVNSALSAVGTVHLTGVLPRSDADPYGIHRLITFDPTSVTISIP